MIKLFFMIIALNLSILAVLAAQMNINAKEVELRTQLISGGLIQAVKEDPVKPTVELAQAKINTIK